MLGVFDVVRCGAITRMETVLKNVGKASAHRAKSITHLMREKSGTHAREVRFFQAQRGVRSHMRVLHTRLEITRREEEPMKVACTPSGQHGSSAKLNNNTSRQ